MTNLHGRALEDEFLSIATSLDGDLEGRQKGAAYLEAINSTYHGRPLSWSMSPKILDDAQAEILRDAAETMARIMDKVSARFLTDPELRAEFGLSATEEELSLVPTGYNQLVPLARLDVFFNEETGDYQFCDINTDGMGGMALAQDVTRAVQMSETFRRFADRHRGVEAFDVVGALIDALHETYLSWANAAEGARRPQNPVMGILDFDNTGLGDEVGNLLVRLADAGVHARCVSVSDLRIATVGGQACLMDAEGPLDCVYRRAATPQLVADAPEAAKVLAEASRRGLACVINGFRAWPVGAKTFFSALHSERMEQILDAYELAFVRAHVPASHLLDSKSDLTPFAQRGPWIAKPARGYNTKATVAGRDLASDDEWHAALTDLALKGCVVSEYSEQYATPVIPAGGALEEGSDPCDFRPANNMLGLFVFRGRFAGVYPRCGYNSVIGEWTSRMHMGCLVVHE